MNFYTNKKKKRASKQEALDLLTKQDQDLREAEQAIVGFRDDQLNELNRLHKEKMGEIQDAYRKASAALFAEENDLVIELERVHQKVKLQKEQCTQERLSFYAACKKALDISRARDITKLRSLVSNGLNKHAMEKFMQQIDQFYAEKNSLLQQADGEWKKKIDVAFREGIKGINEHWSTILGHRIDRDTQLYFFYQAQEKELCSLAEQERSRLESHTADSLENISEQYKKNIKSICENVKEHIYLLRKQVKYRKKNTAIVCASLLGLYATGGLSTLASGNVTPLLDSKDIANLVNGVLLLNGCAALRHLVDGIDVAGIYFEGRVPLGRSSDLHSSSFDASTRSPTHNNIPMNVSIERLRHSVSGTANRIGSSEHTQLLSMFGLQPPSISIPRQPTSLPLGSGYRVPQQGTWGLNMVLSNNDSVLVLSRRTYQPLSKVRAASSENGFGLSNNRRWLDQNRMQFQVFLPMSTRPQSSLINLAFSFRPNNQYVTMHSSPTKPSLGEKILNWFIPVANASDIPLDNFRTEQNTTAATDLEDLRSQRKEYRYERNFNRDYMVKFGNGTRVGLKTDAYLKVYESHGEDEHGNYSLQAQTYSEVQVRFMEEGAHYSFGDLSTSIDVLKARFKLDASGSFGETGVCHNIKEESNISILSIQSTFKGSKYCALSLCIQPEAYINGRLLEILRSGYRVSFKKGGINFKLQPNFTRDPNEEQTTEERIISSVTLLFSKFHQNMLDNFARTEDYDAIANNPFITEQRKQDVVYPVFDRCYM